MKKCSKCKVDKKFDDYHIDNTSIDGYTSQCRNCRQTSSKNYYQTDRGKETHRATEALRRANNPKSTLLSLAKQRAKKKNIKFDLSIDDFEIPIICPVLNIPIISSSKINDNSPSLDRINNNLGYVKENVRVISWRANRLKSDASVLELEKILSYMYEALPEFRTKTGSRKQQRPSKYYSYNGKSQGLIDWAEEYNISYGVLNNRINRDGWDFEKAILTPVKIKKKASNSH